MQTFNPSTGATPYYPPYPSAVPAVPYPGTPRMSVIAGRSVNNVDEIIPGEVPMDGSMAVFPKNDGSIVYVKYTGGNGLIETKYFIPAPEGFSESSSEDASPEVTNQDILNAIMNMTDSFDDIKNFVKNKPYKNNNKNNNRNNNQQNHNNQNGSEEKVENNA